jgi:hypothetical protein
MLQISVNLKLLFGRIIVFILEKILCLKYYYAHFNSMEYAAASRVKTPESSRYRPSPCVAWRGPAIPGIKRIVSFYQGEYRTRAYVVLEYTLDSGWRYITELVVLSSEDFSRKGECFERTSMDSGSRMYVQVQPAS